VASEGKLIALVPPNVAETALAALRRDSLGREAAIIGEITADHAGFVILKTRVGGPRVVDMLSGEQLPRVLLDNRLRREAAIGSGRASVC
jgi:hydrogenase expression/formation protein HypE